MEWSWNHISVTWVVFDVTMDLDLSLLGTQKTRSAIFESKLPDQADQACFKSNLLFPLSHVAWNNQILLLPKFTYLDNWLEKVITDKQNRNRASSLLCNLTKATSYELTPKCKTSGSIRTMATTKEKAESINGHQLVLVSLVDIKFEFEFM